MAPDGRGQAVDVQGSSSGCNRSRTPPRKKSSVLVGFYLLRCTSDVWFLGQGEEIKGKSYYTNETFVRDGPADNVYDAYYN